MDAGAATALRQRMQLDDAERWIGEPLSNLVLLQRWTSFADDAERVARMDREAALARGYPTGPPGRGDHVILILVDSLRADHLPMYGYPRNTTPFLSRLYEAGKLERVEWAFSTCSESFCGILSTLSSKEYPALTRRDFRLPDLLHKRGYAIHLLLAGDHDWFGLRDAYGGHVDHDEYASRAGSGPADRRGPHHRGRPGSPHPGELAGPIASRRGGGNGEPPSHASQRPLPGDPAPRGGRDLEVPALRADPAEEHNLLHELPAAFVARLRRLLAGDGAADGSDD